MKQYLPPILSGIVALACAVFVTTHQISLIESELTSERRKNAESQQSNREEIDGLKQRLAAAEGGVKLNQSLMMSNAGKYTPAEIGFWHADRIGRLETRFQDQLINRSIAEIQGEASMAYVSGSAASFIVSIDKMESSAPGRTRLSFTITSLLAAQIPCDTINVRYGPRKPKRPLSSSVPKAEVFEAEMNAWNTTYSAWNSSTKTIFDIPVGPIAPGGRRTVTVDLAAAVSDVGYLAFIFPSLLPDLN